MSTVLENHYDPSYEPKREEIEEYGKWLGMELPKHEPLLWIARDGLKASLPDNWKACKSEKGDLYYFNFKSGESMWDHPMDTHFKQVFKREAEKLEAGGGGDSAPAAETDEVNKKSPALATLSTETLDDNAPMLPPAVADPVELPERTKKTKKEKKERKEKQSEPSSTATSDTEDVVLSASSGSAKLASSSSSSKKRSISFLEGRGDASPAAADTASKTAADKTPAEKSSATSEDGRKPGGGMGKLAALKNLGKGNVRSTSPQPGANPSSSPVTVQPPAAARGATLAPLKSERKRSPLTKHGSPMQPEATPTAGSAFPETDASAAGTATVAAPVASAAASAAAASAGSVPTAASAADATTADKERALKAQQSAVAALRRAHEEELKKLQTTHATRRAELVAKNDAALARHEEGLKQLEEQHSRTLAERKSQLAAVFERATKSEEQKLRQEHERRLEAITADLDKVEHRASEQVEHKRDATADNLAAHVESAATDIPRAMSELHAALQKAIEDTEASFTAETVDAAVHRCRAALDESVTARMEPEQRRVEAEAKSRLLEAQSKSSEQLQALTAAHAAKVAEFATTTMELTAQIEQARSERDAAVAAARTETTQAVQSARDSAEADLASERARFTSAVAQLRAEHESRLHTVREELLREYADAETELRRKARAEYDALLTGSGSRGAALGGTASTSVPTPLESAATDGSKAVGTRNERDSSQSEASTGSFASTGPRNATADHSSSGKPSMSAEALAQAAEAYLHGPLSVSSTEVSPQQHGSNPAHAADGDNQAPPLRSLGSGVAPLVGADGKLSGDALRAAIVNVLTEMAESTGLNGKTTSSSADSGTDAPMPLPDAGERTPPQQMLEGTMNPSRRDAATFVSPQAAVRMQTPQAQHSDASGADDDDDDDAVATVSPIRPAAKIHRPVPPRIPQSLQEQLRVVQRERQQLESAKAFLGKQEDGMQRQRAALKSTRSKWKADVRAAKAAGASASSRRAAMLRKVHTLLDQQAEVLAHDESVLRETRSWLQLKEDRLAGIEQQLAREEAAGVNDSVATNATAAETTAMLAAFLDLAPPLPAYPPPPSAVVAPSPRKTPSHGRTAAVYGGKGSAVPSRGSGSFRDPTSTAGPASYDALASLYPRDVNREATAAHRKPSPQTRPSGRGGSRSTTPAPEVVDRLRRLEDGLAVVTNMMQRQTSAPGSRSASAGHDQHHPSASTRSRRTGSGSGNTVGFAVDTRY